MHMKQMDDSRIPKAILCSETRHSSRKLGRLLLWYSDTCKRDMKLFGMNLDLGGVRTTTLILERKGDYEYKEM